MGTARPTTGSASDQGRRRFNADALAVWAHGGFFDGAAVRPLTADQTMAAAVRDAGADTPPPRWEHVVTASVRSASADNAGRVPIPGGWGRLALVTDGVHRELSGDEIAAVLAYTQDPATAARELTDLALLAGGGDNASATVVEVPLVPALPAQRTDTGPAFPEVAPAADTA